MDGEAGKSSISAYELYRFIEWVLTTALGVLITVWAFVPEEVLEEKLRIIQFPNRYYLLALGNWIGVTILYGEIMFYAISMMRAHPRQSYLTLIDKHTRLVGAPKRARVESRFATVTSTDKQRKQQNQS